MKNLKRKTKVIVRSWKLGDFFRNFLAIVLGVVVTFVGSDMITEYNSQKELAKAMQLVKSELLLNRKEVSEMQERMFLERNSSYYLLQYKGRMHEASRDSLNKYSSIPFQYAYYTFVDDAMEMLKTSSLIQKIEDKELALQIIKTYGGIKEADISFKSFSEAKNRLQSALTLNPEINKFLVDSRDVTEVWEFLFKYPESINLVQQIPNIHGNRIPFQNCLDEIDQAIAVIDKEYN